MGSCFATYYLEHMLFMLDVYGICDSDYDTNMYAHS